MHQSEDRNGQNQFKNSPTINYLKKKKLILNSTTYMVWKIKEWEKLYCANTDLKLRNGEIPEKVGKTRETRQT